MAASESGSLQEDPFQIARREVRIHAEMKMLEENSAGNTANGQGEYSMRTFMEEISQPDS